MDNLKVFLTFLVIAHHAAQAYGPTGGEWIYQNLGPREEWLGNFMTVNASFFMGLFFMLSGFFLPQSLKGKKIRTFISGKLKRLMIPVLFILTVIVPVYFYLASNYKIENRTNFFDYYINTYWLTGIFSYEYGWYMVNLFIYSLVYAVVTVSFKNRDLKLFPHLKMRHILLLAATVGLISSLVRSIYPIDTWIDLFGVIGMEPAHVTQYVLFFAFGILAYKNSYFTQISKKMGCTIFSMGLFMALVIYLSNLGFMKDIMTVVWKMWAIYESFMAVFIAIGLIVLFREYFNKSNKLFNRIAHNAFGAYVFHNLFVVIFQLSFDEVSIGTSFKFLSVSIMSIVASFLTSYFIRKIKFVKVLI